MYQKIHLYTPIQVRHPMFVDKFHPYRRLLVCCYVICLLVEKGDFTENLCVLYCLIKNSVLFNFVCVLTLFQNDRSQLCL